MNEPMAPWELVVWERLSAARAAGRLGHGLLFCGPAEAGQGRLARRLAEGLLCSQPKQGSACGECRSCRLIAAQTHGDLRVVTLQERDDGRLKTEIGVEQIRELGSWFSLTAQLGQAQVALIDPADRLNLSAANAVLKTLEEPAPGRYLLLVSDQLQRLPATVRSRCQRVELRLPEHGEALDWLAAQGIATSEAERALALGEGNPRRALELLANGGVRRCDEVMADLQAVAAGRETPTAVAQRWMAEHTDARLQQAVRLVRDLGLGRAAGTTRAGLTVSGDFHKLAEWSRQADRARGLMSAPLRHELLLTELLLSWKRLARAG